MTTDQKLIEAILTKYPEEAVAIIDSLKSQEIASLLETLSWGQSCTILTALTPYKSGKVIVSVLRDTALVLLEHLPIRNGSVILQQLDKGQREDLLEALPKEVSKRLRQAMVHRQETIGAYLEPTMALTTNMTVAQAIDRIKMERSSAGTHVFYILGKKNALVGYIDVVELLASDPAESIKSVAHEISTSLLPNFLVPEVLAEWDYHFSSLPVTDAQGMFLGTVARKGLMHQEVQQQAVDKDAVQAGNALGDLYLIGLTSLFGTSSQSIKRHKK